MNTEIKVKAPLTDMMAMNVKVIATDAFNAEVRYSFIMPRCILEAVIDNAIKWKEEVAFTVNDIQLFQDSSRMLETKR